MNLRERRSGLYSLAFLILLVAATLLSSLSTAPNATASPPLPDQAEIPDAVQFLLPDRAALNYLVSNGWDLDHDVREVDGGILVTVIATPTELAYLEQERGYMRLGTTFDADAWEEVTAERESALAEETTQAADADTITILRADYWHSPLGDDISVEAKSSAGEDADLTAYWVPAPIFGITCAQAVGLGQVPAGMTFRYSVRLSDPGTNSGSGHVTDRVWQGTVHGPADFDVIVDWPITPAEGNSSDDSAFSWEISQPNGQLIANDTGSFDCDEPLPEVPELASRSLRAFTDAGEYLYHRRTRSVDGRPVSLLTVESSEGGSASAAFNEWLPGMESGTPYQIGFVDHYMDPTELYERIESLAAEFPELAEIVELPYLTNGYRRQAQGILGSSSSSAVVISSHAWGHEGGNDIVVEAVDPAAADQDLRVSVAGNTVTVNLATDASGALTSTAADVIAAINADAAASALVYADPFRGSSGSGLVSPETIQLSDFLNAPPEISRDPWRVRAIRIGRYRDGSRPGVFAYAQEHAREWVPPLVAVETAERLLRNYANGRSRQLVDNLDIFIIPSVNPDGSHFSFYDYGFQRKNMVNYCPRGFYNDPGARFFWGVDVNRNYDVGSLFDGYTGASTFCLSGVFAGPDELSEPESSNVAWLADNFPNIQFSMNIHSSGNYFMWSPGAYVVPGREPLPRPSLGEESYFWQASERILSSIKDYRGLVVTPGRTGPIVDVLYSAAGNSGDRLWYENGFYAWNFEVGGAGFQPNWEEAFAEAMEFSHGLLELFEVAHDFSRDNQNPRSWLEDLDGSEVRNPNYDDIAQLRFGLSEPATVYYTLDGSVPTYDSTEYSSSGLREPGSILTFFEDTTVNWFAVDAAGNTSNNYVPGASNQYFSSEVRVD